MAKPCRSRSEPVTEADGRFGTVGYAIGAQRLGEIEGRAIVDETAILSAQEEAVREVEIGASAVNESGAGLRRSSRGVARIKDQGADSGFGKRREVVEGVPVDISRS